MKILEKLEDKINSKLNFLYEKFQHKFLHPVFLKTKSILIHIKKSSSIYFLKLQNLIKYIREKAQLSILFLTNYINFIKGFLISFFIYLKSKDKNYDFLKKWQEQIASNKLKFLSHSALILFFLIVTQIVFKNSSKIYKGVQALRKPASKKVINLQEVININIFHPVYSESKTLYYNFSFNCENIECYKTLKKTKDGFKVILEKNQHIPFSLPIEKKDSELIEKKFFEISSQLLKSKNHNAILNSVKIHSKYEKRPVYYRTKELTFKVEDFNLQIFLEDSNRNKQVFFDFNVTLSNRNSLLFLEENKIELFDYLNNNIEPILPQFQIESEGKSILREKIKIEIKRFLLKNHIEGQVLDVFIDHLIVS